MLSISFIAVLLVATTIVILGIFTVLTNPRKKINSYFAAMCFCLAGWAFVNYLADANPDNSLLWTRLAFFAIVAGLWCFVLFANVFPRPLIKSSWLDMGLAVPAILTGLVIFLPGFIPRVVVEAGVSNVVTGPLYFIFVAYFFLFLVSALSLLVISQRQARRADRARLNYVFIGIVLMSFGSTLTNLVLPLVLGSNAWAAYGPYFTLFFVGFASYAILKHRLFNIRLVVARSVAYLLLLTTFSVVYGSGLFIASAYLFRGQDIGNLQLSYYAATALVLAFSFHPLQRFFEKVTDKLFFRDRYDSQELYNQFGHILISEFQLESLLHMTLRKICHELDIAQGQLAVLGKDKLYAVEYFGAQPDRAMTLTDFTHLRDEVVVADELESGIAKQTLEGNGIRVSVRMRTKEQLVGYILLGDKLSGDIYSRQDIEVLQVLAQELAVAIVNAKAYEEIAHFNATLTAKVEIATKRLRAANIHLKELDVAKDEFISMASHQLRTPLTTIKGYISMLAEGDAGHMTAQQQEFLNKAYSGSQRMVDLINDLLNVSRLQAGKFTIMKEPCNLVEIVKDEVDQLQSHAKAKNLQLSFVPPKIKLPLIDLDVGKTRQVMMNFMDNAIYYTATGAVTVSLSREGDYVQMEVSDTGIGVPAEAQKHLFGKFYRASNAMNMRPDGTGLGLFLAKRVIEDQGGSIIFESKEGEGSTFGFRIPLSQKVAHKKERKIPVHS